MVAATPASLAPFFATLQQRDILSADEQQALLSGVSETRLFRAGEHLAQQGERKSSSILLLTGFAARYSTVLDGGRQITALQVPGDFVDLHSFPLKVMDHSVEAVVDSWAAFFPHKHLQTITAEHPHLTRLLWMLTLIDSAIQRQWLVTKGRLSAAQQMAHLLCELATRTEVAGLVGSDGTIGLPITQSQLGDALGLSIVHTNRTLQKLRRTQTIEWEAGRLLIRDMDALADLAEFDPTYLHLERLPR